jgi:Tat protein secretion system quality control protein TatD with DNase activity
MKLAEVRQEDSAFLAETLWNNTCRLYGVDSE